MGRGITIPWVEGSIYHCQGVQNTMSRGFDIAWVGSSIYHE